MIECYEVSSSLGTFVDENSFKKAYIKNMLSYASFKEGIEIENTVEPGMPDVLLIDEYDRSIFIETKYAVKGVIEFKKTQIPWYKRHPRLNITIVAYNDLTTNIHTLSITSVYKRLNGRKVRLDNEKKYQIRRRV